MWPTSTQVLHTCMTAWDYKASAYVFEVYVVNNDNHDQEIYIRADPKSAVKHTITQAGASIRPLTRGIPGSRNGRRNGRPPKEPASGRTIPSRGTSGRTRTKTSRTGGRHQRTNPWANSEWK